MQTNGPSQQIRIRIRIGPTAEASRASRLTGWRRAGRTPAIDHGHRHHLPHPPLSGTDHHWPASPHTHLHHISTSTGQHGASLVSALSLQRAHRQGYRSPPIHHPHHSAPSPMPPTHWRCGACLRDNPVRAVRCSDCPASNTHPKAKPLTLPKYTNLTPSTPSPRPLLSSPPPPPPLPTTRTHLSTSPPLTPATPPAHTPPLHSTPATPTPSPLKRKSPIPCHPPPPEAESAAPRPKRRCVEQAQVKLDALLATKKRAAPTSVPSKPTTTPIKSFPTPPPLPCTPPPSSPLPSPPPPPVAAPPVADLSSDPPPLHPYVPPTLSETIALLRSVHSSLSLSSPPHLPLHPALPHPPPHPPHLHPLRLPYLPHPPPRSTSPVDRAPAKHSPPTSPSPPCSARRGAPWGHGGGVAGGWVVGAGGRGGGEGGGRGGVEGDTGKGVGRGGW